MSKIAHLGRTDSPDEAPGWLAEKLEELNTYGVLVAVLTKEGAILTMGFGTPSSGDIALLGACYTHAAVASVCGEEDEE